MPTARAIKGVLASFLGTFVSRYTEYDGYWVFGFLVETLTELRVDLLAPIPGEASTPHDSVIRSARIKFDEQLHKVGLVQSQIRDASMLIQKWPGLNSVVVNGCSKIGSELRFLVAAVTTNGRRYERTLRVFVAPHDPNVERHSARSL
jgi:hypothetical protein